jgi:hypothetical protein
MERDSDSSSSYRAIVFRMSVCPNLPSRASKLRRPQFGGRTEAAIPSDTSGGGGIRWCIAKHPQRDWFRADCPNLPAGVDNTTRVGGGLFPTTMAWFENGGGLV